MSVVIQSAEFRRHSFAVIPTVTENPAAPQNEENARKAADAIVSAGGLLSSGSKTGIAPRLDAPARPLPDEQQLGALLANLKPAGNGDDAVAVQEAVLGLQVVALQALAPEERARLLSGGDVATAALLDSNRLDAVQGQLAKLMGLVSGNGALPYPSVADLAELLGRASPTSDATQELGALLKDAPGLRAAIDEASTLDEEELSVRLHTDPRFAYVLLLVGFLMKLAASQREQAMAMLGFAEQAIRDMGAKMVDSAKEARLAKVVALVVVVVVSAAAVTVGVTAAARNIRSINNHQVKANTKNLEASEAEFNFAKGVNEAGRSAPMTGSQRAQAVHNIEVKRNQASVLMAEHGVNNNVSSVITQSGQVIGQAANASGNVAGSGHEITAAELTAQQEKRRADANTGQQTSQMVVQNAGKTDETLANLFRQAQQAEQDKADTNNAIAHKL